VSRRWPAAAALLAVLALGCGVPTDADPRPIPHERVPFGLLDENPTPSTTPASPEGAVTLTIYLVDHERLAPVTRDVSPPVGPEQALQALLAGVAPQEAAIGMRTAIAPATGVRTTAVTGSEARVDLTRAFLGRGTKEQILAVAQIVYTLTALPGLESVAFTLSGRSVEVPAADGTLRAGPLRRSDFTSVAQL
jgi:spore germination protein GerM